MKHTIRVMLVRSILVMVAILLVAGQNRTCCGENDQSQPRFEVHPAPEWEKWFVPSEAWGAGDGVFSIPLDGARLLFTFGDTFTSRARRKMVNNSIAILRLAGKEASGIEFFFGHDERGEQRSFVVPEENRGLFWLGSGVRDGQHLYLFAAHIETTPGGGPFGFRQIGEYLLTVNNPDASPADWQIRQEKMPFFSAEGDRFTVFGAATFRPDSADDPSVYVYGIDEEKTPLFPIKHGIVARVPKGRINDWSSWQFFCGPASPDESMTPEDRLHVPQHWSHDFRAARRLAPEVASEYSVSYLAALKRYVMVYTHLGLSREIMLRTAPTAVGPWSEATLLYRIPDEPQDRNIFFYAAKAHPRLGGERELVISYVANSMDFGQLVRNPDMYRPRFIRVVFAEDEGGGQPGASPRGQAR